MIKMTYRLHLTTPAFLGDASQRGVWRTPPIKSLVREWWRVAVAPEVGYDLGKLRSREAALFGTATDEGAGESSRQSEIRFALKHWNQGKLTDWGAIASSNQGRAGADLRINHSEVSGRGQVDSLLYLGYGPLLYARGATSLKHSAALAADEVNVISLAFPQKFDEELSRTLALVKWFGTLGGRSRNGWGSLDWVRQDGEQGIPVLSRESLDGLGVTRSLGRCLDLDWPHAIGTDASGPLVWRSAKAFAGWTEAMKFLAQVKVAFRVELGFEGGQPHRSPQSRHILAYPVTNHRVSSWEGAGKGRLANTLRFKVVRNEDRTVSALIYHTPCKPTLTHDGVDLLATWQRVHRNLDANAQLVRLA